MHTSEATADFAGMEGCEAHSQSDCLCDVEPLPGGVPVRAVPLADRLLELGLTRNSIVMWAEEILARGDARTFRLVAEA